MYILAEALRRVELDTVYGLVGIPVTEAAYSMQKVGVRYVGFRFEQQAGMAAATHGYLTRKPGVLLTVSSLGFMNGLTATANATVNCYPMIQISGATDPSMVDMKMGTYEELDQLNTARPLVKLALRCTHAKDIPSAVARAYRAAVSGRPGGVYIDMTTPALAEVMDATEAEKLFYDPVDIYSPVAPNTDAVKRAADIIAAARRPAILLGKGAAYARLEDRVKKLVENYNIPYLPMSMAKGLMPDAGPLSALSCRSTIMKEADVVIVTGARLNWMLSFGRGKWNPDVKFVQLDVEPQEIDPSKVGECCWKGFDHEQSEGAWNHQDEQNNYLLMAAPHATPELDVVVESIGGAKVALEFTRRALLAGKHVVTSNKELVASYGKELLNIAKEKKRQLPLRGQRGRGHPHPAAPHLLPGRQRAGAGHRHPQRHHQLYPHPDDPGGAHL